MMNAPALFPQGMVPTMAPVTQAGPASLTLVDGKMVSFDTLFTQTSAASGESGVAPDMAKTAASGSFENLGVILTLLRSSQQNSSISPSQNDAEISDFAAKNAAPASLPQHGSMLPVNFNIISNNINTLEVDVDSFETAQYCKNAAQHNAPQSDATSPFSTPQFAVATQGHQPILAQMLAQVLGAQNVTPDIAPEEIGLPIAAVIPAENEMLASPTPNPASPLEMPRLDASATPISDAKMHAEIQAEPESSKNSSDTQAAQFAEKLLVNSALLSVTAPSVKIAEKIRSPEMEALVAETVETPRKADTPPLVATQMSSRQPDGDETMARFAPFQRTAPIAPMQNPPALVAMPIASPLDAGGTMQVMFNQILASAPQGPAAVEQSAVTATVSEQILDLTSDDAWIDQIAKDIAATKSASGEISFRLMPRHLGRLDVVMSQNDQGISVRVDAQHEAAASIVAGSQSRLIDELRHQGVRVTSAEVTHNSGDASRQSNSKEHQNQKPDGTHFIETAPERLPDADLDDKGRTSQHGRFA